MASSLAFWIGALAIVWLMRRDIRRRPAFNRGLWLVVLWVIMVSSRSVSMWFNYGGYSMEAESYDSGNPIERATYFLFVAIGTIILYRRRVPLGEVIRANPWVFVFFGFWLLSTFWADEPFISFKRWFKDVGNVVMVLLVLSEARPTDAVKAVFIRASYVLLIMSVIFIRYIPELGRTYHSWSGAMMYTGVATHKNTLGVLALVSALFLLWDILDRWSVRERGRWQTLCVDGSLFLTACWLLFTSHSATSRFCFVVGASLMLLLRLRSIQARLPVFVRFAVVLAGLFVVLDLAFDVRATITKSLLEALDRDPTLTGRTDAWAILLKELDNPLVGAGFNSFWTGERMRRIWEDYAIIQAHNGYVETYLNGGILGVTLLAALLLASGLRIKGALYRGRPFASIQFLIWLTIILHNFSEASYSKLCLLWFVGLLVMTELPARMREAREATESAVEEPEVVVETGPVYVDVFAER